MIRIAVALALLPFVAHAAAPAPGSEDYDALAPYSAWIEKQTGHYGGLCCSLSDCRTAEWRQRNGQVQMYISRADRKGFTKWPEAPNDWLTVPDVVIKREGNPTGQAIACWSKYHNVDNGFYCAFLPDLT